MTLSDLTIRRAHAEDATVLLPMVQSLAAHHGDTALVSAHSLARDMREVAEVFLAFRAGEPVGYAALLPLAQMQFGTRGFDIHHMFVAHAMRGRGVGRALADASVDFARQRGMDFIVVGTHPDNRQAQAIYRNWGFEERPAGGPRFGMRL